MKLVHNANPVESGAPSNRYGSGEPGDAGMIPSQCEADRLGKENRLPIAYQAETDRKSWDAMQASFRKVFQK